MQVRAAVGQLAVAAVGLAPLVEQRQDLAFFFWQRPVHRRTSRCVIVELSAGAAGDPTVRAALGQVELAARAAQRPAGIKGLIEQTE